jgi:Icc-related predicted phosphoesterase
MNKKDKFTVLCIADLHHWTYAELEKLRDLEYDICFLLGDIQTDVLEIIRRIIGKNSLYAVQGNHDLWTQFSDCGISSLNLNAVEKSGYRFAGFGGASRYKDGRYFAMLTQKESLKLAKTFNSNFIGADVLISHDSFYKLFSRDDDAHIGLKGLSRIVKRNKIKLNICGHQHVNKVVKKHGCTVICVYRCSLITLPDLTVENIF